MSTPFTNRNRFVIPRIVPISQMQMVVSPNHATKSIFENLVNQDGLDKYIDEWIKNKNINSALELVSVSSAEDKNNPNVKSAKEFLLANQYKSNQNIRGIVNLFINENNEASVRKSADIIRELKTEIMVDHYNPMTHHDLAFHYLSLGQFEKAKKHIEFAYKYAPTSIIINRSLAASYIILEKNPDKALFYLRKYLKSNASPEIISSEIGIANSFGLKSATFEKAQKNIQTKNMSFGLAELFANIGTVNLINGRLKDVKVQFKNSLLNANENIIAQIFDLYNKGYLKINDYDTNGVLRVPLEFEANSISLFRKDDFDGALIETDKWTKFQPFETNSRIFKSYILANIKEDHFASLDVIQQGLLFDRDNFTLLNNSAYSLLQVGRIDLAEKILMILNSKSESIRNTAILKATNGLLNYKRGNSELGNRLYLESQQMLKNQNIPYLYQMSMLCHLKEKLNMCEVKENEYEKLKTELSNSKFSDIVYMVKKLKSPNKR